MSPPSTPSADASGVIPLYGFVIDNRKCIGCHACSVACKSENEVPLGVNRTWVKYVETGAFPNTRRHFQVTRCNHCANPPCVRICPTAAMYQRADGIVEFDNRACIGCKACLQACPYDAIYIDPESHTAAKCHYCAHRTDVGLEPACVVVCPEQAIIAGDMHDPDSAISRLLATEKVSVRKPEQGTAPKLFYIHGHDVSLHPTATERAPTTFMWADVLPLHPQAAGVEAQPAHPAQPNRPINAPQAQGHPWSGPIHIGAGRQAEQMVQVGYNAQHHIPWHWPVPAYLVTKSIGAGIFMLYSLAVGLRLIPPDAFTGVVMGFLSLLFIGLTTGLLVYDLEQPLRFLYILRRPQWRSWLTRGAVLLISYTLVGGAWWLFELGAYLFDYEHVIRHVYLWIGLPLATGAAIYTAFLFAQAEGRDLWQSPLLPFHLALQALMAGSAAFLIIALFVSLPAATTALAGRALALTLIIDLFVTLVGEFGMPHASETAAQAAHAIRQGRYRRHFWQGSILAGHLLPLVLLLFNLPWLSAVAGVAVIAGLYAYEYAFVMAPQEVPNS